VSTLLCGTIRHTVPTLSTARVMDSDRTLVLPRAPWALLYKPCTWPKSLRTLADSLEWCAAPAPPHRGGRPATRSAVASEALGFKGGGVGCGSPGYTRVPAARSPRVSAPAYRLGAARALPSKPQKRGLCTAVAADCARAQPPVQEGAAEAGGYLARESDSRLLSPSRSAPRRVRLCCR
jgi:hypothetical protein